MSVLGKSLVLAAGLGLGTAAYSYFSDENNGKKRRIQTRKKIDKALKMANETVNDLSRQFTKQTSDLSKDLREQVTKQSNKVAEYQKKGWKPSSRLLGALASAFAFYGASRSGLLGIACRTVSLSMFTRALLAPR
jgi:hypothetical protein